MDDWREFAGPNAGYVIELYERYRRDPASVDTATRTFFERWTPPLNGLVSPPSVAVAQPAVDPMQVAGVVRIAEAIRSDGHLAASLDPLGHPPPGAPSLNLASYGLTEADLATLPASLVGGPLAQGAANALQTIQALRQVYCGTTGYDTAHIRVSAERDWLRDAAESGRFRPPRDPIDALGLLQRLTHVEAFERFLQRAFPGQTRFSIEGIDMLVPMLDQIVGHAAESGTRWVLLGMAHRGRLNVLAHVLGKTYTQILSEFLNPARSRSTPGTESRDGGWTGDVKYHLGAIRAVDGEYTSQVQVTMAPNPSHLEYINPVVEGMARASQEDRSRPGKPAQDEALSLPVLIHGDASFPGQGIVAETLNLSQVPGYCTGGTIHIIGNNQIGFTTPPSEGRSTLYASDLAKGFKIPIVHVNADDPEACIAAARLAYVYRQQFHKDFMIDLIGYRRWGHNEGDEPSFTQPVMSHEIAEHPSVRKLWAQELIRRGLETSVDAEAMLKSALDQLQKVRDQVPAGPPPEAEEVEPLPAPPAVETAVPAKELIELDQALLRFPPNFTPNPKLARAMQRRHEEIEREGGMIDWAHAEELAFASVLVDGTSIRLTGQDTQRGTFTQRHLVFHDFENGKTYTPLQELPQCRASFAVYNSPLSESAVLGFEYGYDVQAENTLVLWEAQYGDFVNSGQVMIDQFVASARAKWDLHPSLVLLLPHGYEGQGPEHSSGRVERFLQLAAENNLRIANCTTAAQYFHLLRRQAKLLAGHPVPLVVMTPKSLLRHSLAASPLNALSSGTFQPVIDDDKARAHSESIQRLVLCSGKVFIDLLEYRQRELEKQNGQPGEDGKGQSPLPPERRIPVDTVALARVEELYPFPENEIRAVIEGYPQLREVVWVQEEPRNMGAWTYMAPRLRDILAHRFKLGYVGRPRRASPAEGSAKWHAAEQARIVTEAFSELLVDENPPIYRASGAQEVSYAR